MRKPIKKILENAVERELVRRVTALGGLCDKVQIIGKRGCFDRLVVLPGARIFFIECKRPYGGSISPHQRRYHAELAARGVPVVVINTAADIDRLLGL
jgi:hypothetical protein